MIRESCLTQDDEHDLCGGARDASSFKQPRERRRSLFWRVLDVTLGSIDDRSVCPQCNQLPAFPDICRLVSFHWKSRIVRINF